MAGGGGADAQVCRGLSSIAQAERMDAEMLQRPFWMNFSSPWARAFDSPRVQLNRPCLNQGIAAALPGARCPPGSAEGRVGVVGEAHEPGAIDNLERPALRPDESGLLKRLDGQRDAGAPHIEHYR